MENQEDNANTKLTELLKELASVQADNMKLSFAINAREMRDKAADKIKNVKEYIQNTAKIYGEKAKKLAEEYVQGTEGAKEVEELEETIAKLTEEYEKGLNPIYEKRAELETKEQSDILKLEDLKNKRKQLLENNSEKNENLEKIENTRKDLTDKLLKAIENKTDFMDYVKELNTTTKTSSALEEQINKEKEEIEKIDAEIKNLEKAINDAREEIKKTNEEEEKYCNNNKKALDNIEIFQNEVDEKRLSIPKQNILQKSMGWLFNKINGASKFTRNVIDKVKNETARIANEEIPKAAEEVKGKTTGTINSITSKAKDIKLNVIQRVQNSIDEKQKTNAELSKRRNEQLGKDENVTKENQEVVNNEKNQNKEDEELEI